MALKDNLEYWKISLENPELPGEELYTRDIVIVDKNDYCSTVNRLRELIITYCTVSEIDKSDSLQMEIVKRIDEIIINTENIQYTEFVAYWKSSDMTYSGYEALDVQTRLTVLTTLLNRYCEQRRKLYDQLGYTHVIQQALYDSASARSQSKAGVRKVQQLLTHVVGREVHPVEDVGDFNSQSLCILLPDRNKAVFTDWLSHWQVRYSFGQTHQGKLPDILIKMGSIVFVLEAKHVKEPGGAQDKQITELIDYIRQQEQAPIHYVAFLDGLYFNLFCQPVTDTKPYRQRQDIEAALKQFNQNYFVNTKGLLKLLQDAYNSIPAAEAVREPSESVYRPRTLFDRSN